MFILLLYVFQSLMYLGCVSNEQAIGSENDLPPISHDLSYTSFDAKLDDPNYAICDSTAFLSGRNRVWYEGGNNQFRKDLKASYKNSPAYATFDGFVVIRFLVNCEGKTGRYRAEALNLDFTPGSAPEGLLEYAVDLVKRLDNWTKSTSSESFTEYSKFINLKIRQGEIEHVLM